VRVLLNVRFLHCACLEIEGAVTVRKCIRVFVVVILLRLREIWQGARDMTAGESTFSGTIDVFAR
jgi:hypothetical protein